MTMSAYDELSATVKIRRRMMQTSRVASTTLESSQ